MPVVPPLTIVVVGRNPGPLLGVTLASIGEQRHVAPELIVVDRGSTDGTAAWLEANRARFTAVVAVPREHTLAMAWNAAIAAATGDWVLLLDAGDRLVGDLVLSEALNWLKKTEAGIAAGEAAHDSGRIARLHSHVNPVARDFLGRSATFYRRSLFAENGDFEISLAAMASYELHVRLWKNRVRFKTIPLRIAAVATEPVFDWRACAEERRVRHRYFAAWRCWWWDLRSFMRWARAGFRRALRW